ncbi:MAG: phosphate ABC transporter ATP-binding protein PstB [Alphaproteobacteria bacterium]|jgi:phosphate transport system ATP-binding protein|nr:phosphate ABC transporter ATP-binding protein PstB [Alphaproteobacteria bacterium]MBL6938983.1 phosphate ABC transporter ATP-binding protein PstB [Alphaproteobacteria bacterium]MBL7099575.1 phosphate ABC transporter ATP-binding protein PstB [Alphaproteobacteria bacterium]
MYSDLSTLAVSPAAPPKATSEQPPPVKLEARHITFRYADTVALTDVSVPLYANRTTAFMGPSGCGKSTLLRVFNRMHDLYPDQQVDGEVLLDGQNILRPEIDVNLVRSRIGMVFQKPLPFPMTIYDNVAFGVRLYRQVRRADMDALVEQALRHAALWDEVKDILSQSGLALSGGQQQRLCIARAIAVKPDVLLLDEPCSALDPRSTALIEETMDRLKQRYTIAIVTHNLQQANRVSDYAAFMYLGEMVEFGPSGRIFANPGKERTRKFVTGRFG